MCVGALLALQTQWDRERREKKKRKQDSVELEKIILFSRCMHAFQVIFALQPLTRFHFIHVNNITCHNLK